jgi:hypothetical protein
MKKTKKAKIEKAEKPEKESKVLTAPVKFGVLGKDISSKFSSGGNGGWRPTKAGGRNGQGKP